MHSFIQKSLAKEPITTLKNHLVISSSNRVLVFLFSSFHPSFASPFFPISQAVSFSSQQIFVTTCILLLPYFIIHGKPLLAHYRYASRYQTPHSPSCNALALNANPHQICHSYSDTQIHIMKCNFFRFMEQEDFSKEDDKLDQNICVFLLSWCNSQIPRAISRNGKVT